MSDRDEFDPERPITRDELASFFRQSFTARDDWRVGLEIEHLGVDAGTGMPLPFVGDTSITSVLEGLRDRFDWQDVRDLPGDRLGGLKRGDSAITLEPGAQLELASAPALTTHELDREHRTHLEELRAVAGERIAWLGTGYHPLAALADAPHVPRPRYDAAREFIVTRGSTGLDMMYLSCSTQVNLDYASERDACRKLRVANAIAPISATMFANSPFYRGAVAATSSRRLAIWLDLDPDRTGIDPFTWGSELSFERYVEWVLDARLVLMVRDGRILANPGVTFRQLMRDGYRGFQATVGDWMVHANTCFPEARIKFKTLEIRGPDSLPASLVPAVPALYRGLLYDPDTLAWCEQLIADWPAEEVVRARQETPAQGLRVSLAGRPLSHWASDLVQAAWAGLERLARAGGHASEAGYLEPIAELLADGRTPADVLLERARAQGTDPAALIAICRA